MAMDPRDCDALTFDCYGTLIDWESGILAAFRPITARAESPIADDAVLEAYARHEAAAEAGPYRPYREVLAVAARGVAGELGVVATDDEIASFAGSVPDWPAFPDSAEALGRLRQHVTLGVITNCDARLFAASERRLGMPFHVVVTAEEVRAYKPATAGFETAFARLGLPAGRVVHVAQSLFHDHVPAKRLGLRTVWVNRRGDRPGSGATPPANAKPDLVVPDMASLADLFEER
jgi:2-haloacid dehalogenase